MRRLTTLSEKAAAILDAYHRKHGNDILAASPWVKADMEMPHRMVIRDERDCYVVHMQVIDETNGIAFYVHGNYVNKTRPDTSDALERAWAHFESRSRRTLGLPDGLPDKPTAENER